MWVLAVIPVNIFKGEAQMYKFLEDFIKYCDDYKWCETFHFFIENSEKMDDCLELRMECSDRDSCQYPVCESQYSADLTAWLINQGDEFKPGVNIQIDTLSGTIISSYEFKPGVNIKLKTVYRDETGAFGEDGWQIAKNLFEYTSRAAVHIKTGKAHNLFRETKFIHCFLNQCGYDSLKESAFHSMAAWQMLVKHLREEK
jgi:hypothetical protein